MPRFNIENVCPSFISGAIYVGCFEVSKNNSKHHQVEYRMRDGELFGEGFSTKEQAMAQVYRITQKIRQYWKENNT